MATQNPKDKKALEPYINAVLTAFEQFHNGEPATSKCPSCNSAVAITQITNQAWRSQCDCGRCNDQMRGL